MTALSDWANLSDDATSILEWIESPYTGRQAPLGVSVGDYPTIDGRPRDLIGRVVDETLFQEIAAYVVANGDDFVEVSVQEDRLKITGLRPYLARSVTPTSPSP